MLNARCESEVDLIAYQLGEATAAERRAVEVHIRSCEECAGELARLGVTQAALLSVREEEPPRRIAFVSDKVFEPTWYQRLWQPMPAWALGAASLLQGEAVPVALSALSWTVLVFQVVVVTFASYLVWFWLVRHYPATRLSAFTLLTPMFGLLAGVGLLDEPMTMRLATALAAVCVGIWLVNRPRPAAPAATR